MFHFERPKNLLHGWAGAFFGAVLAIAWIFEVCPAVQAQGRVEEPVLAQMVGGWGDQLEKADMKGLSIYYVDPIMVHPWQQRLSVARIDNAELLAIHWIQSATDRYYDGIKILAETEFTMEFRVQGFDRPYNETRLWGLTTTNGYLQVAYEMKKKEALVPPRVSPGPPPGTVNVSQPLPDAPGTSPQSLPGPGFQPLPAPVAPQSQLPVLAQQSSPPPVATPTLNEDPVPRDELVQQLWDSLLMKFKKAYEYRNERMFARCFVKTPRAAMEQFREDIRGRNWMQVDKIEIDAGSVRGNNLNSTFRFRYSLWGTGLKRGEMREVDCAAIRGGPGWRFARFGDELLEEPARPPGYYPTTQFISPLVSPAPQNQGFQIPFLNR